MKLIDARRDQYRKLAHEQGYRSRAAYKLKELNKAYRILGPGFYVLDLGCAPGGWTQMALRLVGNQGKVMGIDSAYVEDISGAYLLKGDIEDESIIDEIFSYFDKKVDAVICDLSPQVIGNWTVDHSRQISLNYEAAKIMDKVLSKKGNALFKVFDGEFSNEFRDYLKAKFSKLRATKPKASRKPSSELYFVCLGYKG
ncbi:MAG: 23S rRNA (uridine(2552)-2'-O)-methyltransferase [Nitrosopumilaceae archaeon]|nr:RlmE family RNA methyltransferase [Nitrosopumilaceae archaeon]NIT99462.1 RlmE family RNA methyltransferase [Nitrosopumilaceae archaeon]NIU85821.1 23S rRNA (uridine(2552)-2'-O)-methyltransferase [Nitrosopumilaceae archaeon]NIV64678.1 23S rRNA (uridine(2552)-2'-O)-methyltransferase [Nitrosopumilaceae archaeon]NIX60065.1 23S rRNA (uridine(2552)-2'-O)-methyltransferase [Nitrosopumilaceae archaeon]